MEKEMKWQVVLNVIPSFESYIVPDISKYNQLNIKIQIFSFPKFLFYSRQ